MTAPGPGRPADAPRGRHAAAIASVAWMAVIFGLSALHGSDVPGSGRLAALGHFTVYAVLGALYASALAGRLTPARAALLAIVVASLYGVTDEFHQSFVPGRTPDPVDWLVDTAGAALGAGLVWWRAQRGGRDAAAGAVQ